VLGQAASQLQPPEQLCAQHLQLLLNTCTHYGAVLVRPANQVGPGVTAHTSKQQQQQQQQRSSSNCDEGR
jgi:hypothetical protein